MLTATDLERVAHLANLETIEAFGRTVDDRAVDDGAAGRWRTTSARFVPGASPYCTLLLESDAAQQRLCRVEVFETAQPVLLPVERSRADPLLGWVRVTPFPHDPMLPTLARVIERAQPARIVRYRALKRCTLRGTSAGRDCFIKVFPDEQGAVIHRDSEALWAASARGAVAFRVAEPIRYERDERAVWQGVIHGEPIIEALYGSEGIAMARRIGAACGSLPRSSLSPAMRFDWSVQMDRSRRYARTLERYDAGLAAQAGALLDTLAATYDQRPHRPEPRPIHGAPHAHQWLDCGDALGLVDFDRFSIGDPELDAATFIGELDYERRTMVPVPTLVDAFLDAYQHAVGPLDPALLRAYRAHKHLAKALRSVRALRTDSVRRAARALERARGLLAQP